MYRPDMQNSGAAKHISRLRALYTPSTTYLGAQPNVALLPHLTFLVKDTYAIFERPVICFAASSDCPK